MWFDRVTSGKSRSRRGKGAGAKRRQMFVVNARLKDRKTKWAPHLGSVLLVLLAIGAALALGSLAVRSAGKAIFTENDSYTLTNIVVVCKENPVLGNEVLNSVINLRGTNLFRVPISAIRDRLVRKPCVKSAKVSRILPHKLEIIVSERLPVACLGNRADVSRHLVVDDDGVIFVKDRNLPVLSGYGEAKSTTGDTIKKQVKDALTVLSYCDVSPAGQRLRIAAIEIKKEYLEVKLEDGLQVLLEWNRDVADVKLQRRELETRLNLLVTVMSKAAQAGVTLLTVDLTGDDPKRCVTTPRWTGGND